METLNGYLRSLFAIFENTFIIEDLDRSQLPEQSNYLDC